MKNLYFVTFLLLIILSLFSCNKVLELTPISEISNNNYWNSKGDALAGLNGMYVKLRKPASSSFYMWGEARSDIMGPSYLGAVANFDLLYYGGLDATNSAYTYNGGDITWKNIFSIIHQANLLIKYVPSIVDLPTEEKNSIIAEAYSMRAYLYFLMVKIWGDVPIITEPIESIAPDRIYVERNSSNDVFEFIKDDIELALNLFPNNEISINRNKWSKPSVNVLKGDVYLWTAKKLNGGASELNIALNALNEAENTDSDLYLLDKFSDVFSYSNKGNDEILMSVNFSELEVRSGLDRRETRFMYIHPAIPGNVSSKTREAIGAPSPNGGYWAPRPEITELFSYDDQRRDASFYQIFTQDDNGDSTFYASLVYKFRGFESGGRRAFLDDVVLYRYADILLLRAEIHNALGMDPSNDINEIRKRAYGDDVDEHIFTNGSKEENDAAILRERLFEFIFEGKRWWDLIRFDKAFEKVPYLQNQPGNKYLLLFPISEITLSVEPNITQNPGY